MAGKMVSSNDDDYVFNKRPGEDDLQFNQQGGKHAKADDDDEANRQIPNPGWIAKFSIRVFDGEGFGE